MGRIAGTWVRAPAPNRRKKLTKMLTDELRHFKHIDHGFTAKDGFELIVGIDISFVLGILKIVLLDVFPKGANDFSAGIGSRANDRSEVGA